MSKVAESCSKQMWRNRPPLQSLSREPESADILKRAAQSVFLFLLLVIDRMLIMSKLLLKSNNLTLPHNLNAALYRLG